MIPATVPCYARYQCKLRPDDEKGYWEYRRVLAWDDDGDALVQPNKGGRLVRAASFRNFDGLSEDANYSPIVALIPAGGWRVERTYDDGGAGSEPLIGWGLREDGSVVPLETDCNGDVEALDHTISGKWRITHDDQRGTPAAGTAEDR